MGIGEQFEFEKTGQILPENQKPKVNVLLSGAPMDHGWMPHKPETWQYRFARLRKARMVGDHHCESGDWVKIVMVSRIGDVGITNNLDGEHSYESRVELKDLFGFSSENPNPKPRYKVYQNGKTADTDGYPELHKTWSPGLNTHLSIEEAIRYANAYAYPFDTQTLDVMMKNKSYIPMEVNIPVDMSMGEFPIMMEIRVIA